MGRIAFKLPDIGEGIAEAEIVAWHVAVGDMVEEDAPLADMMTDKATVEMTAPVAGRIVEIAGAVGDMIAIGSVLAVFESEGEAAEEADRGGGAARGVAGGRAEAGKALSPSGRGWGEGRDGRDSKHAVDRSADPSPRPSPRWGEGEEGARLARRAGAGEGSRRRSGAGEAGERRSRAPCRSRRLSALCRARRAGRPPRVGATKASRRSASPACAAASPRTWPRPSAGSRISPMSRKPTSRRWRRCAPTLNAERGRPAEADAAAVPDPRDHPRAARLSDDQRALRRRGQHRLAPRRRASGARDADRCRPDGAGDPRRRRARPVGARRRDRAASPMPRGAARRRARR